MDEKVIRAAFIPFGDISEVQIPQDYATEKHRGFAFIDFELPEDAQAAIDNMHDAELFGRTLRVNLAKPLRVKENATKPVWADEEWLQMYDSEKKEQKEQKDNEESSIETNSSKETPVKRSAQEAIEAAGAMVRLRFGYLKIIFLFTSLFNFEG